jgi:hypothetical protein
MPDLHPRRGPALQARAEPEDALRRWWGAAGRRVGAMPASLALALALPVALSLPELLWRPAPLEAVAPATRDALVTRIEQTLHEVCGPHSDPAVEQLCREEARLVVQLEECDAACRALAASVAVHPTR